MIRRVCTRAYSNIALIKYWGKAAGPGNLPATPSISMALKALETRTEITRLNSVYDKIFLNGIRISGKSYDGLVEYLNYWRKIELISGFFRISSNNNFPTGAGLASSASGFAALATALGAFSKRKMEVTRLSRLARRGSGSAARSITGGLSAFPTGDDPAARILLPPDDIPWGMVVAIIDSRIKPVSSREGMEISRRTSPYYKSWIKQAGRDYRAMLKMVRNPDFTAIGEIAEANCLAMHSCMIASRPSLIYWNPATIRIISTVKDWRKRGLEVYFTIDAGPNAVLFGKREDLKRIAQKARKIPGVSDVINSLPGGGAEVLSRE